MYCLIVSYIRVILGKSRAVDHIFNNGLGTDGFSNTGEFKSCSTVRPSHTFMLG